MGGQWFAFFFFFFLRPSHFFRSFMFIILSRLLWCLIGAILCRSPFPVIIHLLCTPGQRNLHLWRIDVWGQFAQNTEYVLRDLKLLKNYLGSTWQSKTFLIFELYSRGVFSCWTFLGHSAVIDLAFSAVLEVFWVSLEWSFISGKLSGFVFTSSQSWISKSE